MSTAAKFDEPDEIDNKVKQRAKVKRIILKTVDAMDELMRSLGQRAVDAVIKSIRGSLDELWRVFGVREATSLFKDVPIGKKVKAGEPFSRSRI